MAFKIAVSNQKGGTGKTTISVNIAAAFEAGGNKVALIDADPQGTSVRWVTSGENTLPMTVLSGCRRGIGGEIKKQDANFDVIVVDALETSKTRESPPCSRSPTSASCRCHRRQPISTARSR